MSENKESTIAGNDLRSILKRAIVTGFVGGILAGLMAIFMYYFNFAEVHPKHYLLTSWIDDTWAQRWIGDVVSVILIGFLSIIVALIYFLIFKKIYAMWVAGLFGLVMWGIVFFMLQPLFTNIQPLTKLSQDTIISTICLFLLYGVFIGYSISYDYIDTIRMEDEGSKDSKRSRER